MHDERGGGDAGEGSDSVGLTRSTSVGSIAGRSDDREKFSIAASMLEPLRKGKAVVLEVDDARLPKRKRIEKPLLFLTPQTLFGVPSSKLIVSLQTYGCEVIDTREEIKPLMLIRTGLSARMSGSLASELNRVFRKGEPYGSEST